MDSVTKEYLFIMTNHVGEEPQQLARGSFQEDNGDDDHRRAKAWVTSEAKLRLGLDKIEGKWEPKAFGFVRWHGSVCLELHTNIESAVPTNDMLKVDSDLEDGSVSELIQELIKGSDVQIHNSEVLIECLDGLLEADDLSHLQCDQVLHLRKVMLSYVEALGVNKNIFQTMLKLGKGVSI